jgi:hypothetical protein
VSAARVWSGVFLALQHCSDETEAERLIARLADPFTQRLARREWRELHAATVKTIRSAL